MEKPKIEKPEIKKPENETEDENGKINRRDFLKGLGATAIGFGLGISPEKSSAESNKREVYRTGNQKTVITSESTTDVDPKDFFKRMKRREEEKTAKSKSTVREKIKKDGKVSVNKNGEDKDRQIFSIGSLNKPESRKLVKETENTNDEKSRKGRTIWRYPGK